MSFSTTAFIVQHLFFSPGLLNFPSKSFPTYANKQIIQWYKKARGTDRCIHLMMGFKVLNLY